MTARLLDEAVNLAQPKSRAFAYGLRREEGLKRLRHGLPVHAAAGITDRYDDVLPRHHFAVGRDIGFIDMGVAGLERQLSSIWHGIPSVDGEIEDGGLELVRVGFRAPQTGAEDGLYGDGLAESAMDHFGKAIDQNVDVDRLWIERLPARECQKALGK